MTAPSQAVERYTIEPHGEAGNFALYFGRDSGRHGMRLLNLNDGDSRMDAHIALIERALNRYDALTARVRELEAALKIIAGDSGIEATTGRARTFADVARAALANSLKESA